MWVICGGMQRSGSTLQFQIAARLVEDRGLGRRIEWRNARDFSQLRDKYASFSGIKVFKTHTLTEEIRKEFYSGNAVGLYIYRDLRDVFVSSMTKEGSDFSTTWKSGLLDKCVAGFNAWTGLPDVLISRYEDVMASLDDEVSMIAGKIGVSLSPVEIARIAEDYSIEKQKKRMRRVRKEKKVFDEKELLHDNHINSGKEGQWRKRLNTLQILRIEWKIGRWLRDHGYELSGAGRLLVR